MSNYKNVTCSFKIGIEIQLRKLFKTILKMTSSYFWSTKRKWYRRNVLFLSIIFVNVVCWYRIALAIRGLNRFFLSFLKWPTCLITMGRTFGLYSALCAKNFISVIKIRRSRTKIFEEVCQRALRTKHDGHWGLGLRKVIWTTALKKPTQKLNFVCVRKNFPTWRVH